MEIENGRAALSRTRGKGATSELFRTAAFDAARQFRQRVANRLVRGVRLQTP